MPNLRRGFRRVFLVFSILWVVVSGFFLWQVQPPPKTYIDPSKVQYVDPSKVTPDEVQPPPKTYLDNNGNPIAPGTLPLTKPEDVIPDAPPGWEPVDGSLPPGFKIRRPQLPPGFEPIAQKGFFISPPLGPNEQLPPGFKLDLDPLDLDVLLGSPLPPPPPGSPLHVYKIEDSTDGRIFAIRSATTPSYELLDKVVQKLKAKDDQGRKRAWLRSWLRSWLEIGLVPPLAAFALLESLLWAARGFAQHKP